MSPRLVRCRQKEGFNEASRAVLRKPERRGPWGKFIVSLSATQFKVALGWFRLDSHWRSCIEFADKTVNAESAGLVCALRGAWKLGRQRGMGVRKALVCMMLRIMIVLFSLFICGCNALPTITREPTLHNPFPQLSKVAVAQFFNDSSEKTIDMRQVASAYASELQLVPGFEVLPVGVVETAMREHRITLRGPDDARRLAQILGADALVVGVVTEYYPYYPPRLGLHVEWYAANPAFHPIPPGYGLPWGTTEEGDIPGELVLEAEMALAKAQLQTQTPPIESRATGEEAESPAGTLAPPPAAAPIPGEPPRPLGGTEADGSDPTTPLVKETSFEEEIASADPSGEAGEVRSPAGIPPGSVFAQIAAGRGGPQIGIPENWPDPRGFVPPPPSPRPPTCWPSSAPVMRHVKMYKGNDPDFTEALAGYYEFRDDARFGGWQAYLERSGDFIPFCCRMHIWEMLGARGGAGETRVVWRWPTNR